MLMIKNNIYLSILSFLYLTNANSYMFYLVFFKIFTSNYRYVKEYIIANEYLNKIQLIIFFIKYIDIIYKMYINIILSCFNCVLKYIKNMIFKEVIPTKEFKTKKHINDFLDEI
jgi:hypothetical protein